MMWRKGLLEEGLLDLRGGLARGFRFVWFRGGGVAAHRLARREVNHCGGGGVIEPVGGIVLVGS